MTAQQPCYLECVMAPNLSSDLIAELEASHRHFADSARGLSDAAAARKPAEDRWSVVDCVEHLCITEALGLKRMQAAEQALTDESAPIPEPDLAREAAIAAQVADRTGKKQGPPAAMPTGRFTTLEAALAEFSATRARTIGYVNGCSKLAALRIAHPVFGPLTGREYVIVAAGHSRRHAAQIAEIRAQIGSAV
jgi:hypothetical protein